MSSITQSKGSTTADRSADWPGQAEFVTIIALLMALNALSIDIVLPAMGVIGNAFGQATGNDIQLLVTAYVMAFGVGQLLLGGIADRFGRKPLLLIGLAGFGLANLFAAAAPTFDWLLVGRVLQGLTAATLRVLAVAIVRDRFAGRRMARIMSLVMLVFMVVPLLAPAMGQGLMMIGPWPLLFYVTGAVAMILAFWVWQRLPESLPPESRRPVSVSALKEGYAFILRTRTAWGYMLAGGFVFGVLMSFITAANQIMLETYEIGAWFPLAFAGVASGMIVSNLYNAKLVETFGMRALSHTALVLFAGACVFHAGLAFIGFQPLWVFVIMMAIPVFLLGFLGANFTALALDPVGRVAGLATSLQGFLSTGVAGALGGYVAHLYDGTAKPFAYGIAVLSLCSLGTVFWTERGQLRAFRFVRDLPESSATSS